MLGTFLKPSERHAAGQGNTTTLFVSDSFKNRRRQTPAYMQQGVATDTFSADYSLTEF
jgi:hypothetical protein